MNATIEEWVTDALDAPEGSVNTSGGITFSDPSGGCGEPGCKCSPGWWLSVALPADAKGMVKGWNIHFTNAPDMREFIELARERFNEWLERPF